MVKYKHSELLEQEAMQPDVEEERFSGYGVLGVCFSTGHVLAMRHFSFSSIGPGYSSVWLRNPIGMWTFYTDVEPHLSCTRYFGKGVADVTVTPIHLNWKEVNELEVTVEEAKLKWALTFKSTAKTTMLNVMSSMLPQNLWKKERMLRKAEAMASKVLDAGTLSLSGKVPNGQLFQAKPKRVQLVARSNAYLDRNNLGTVVQLLNQAHIGQFCIPRVPLYLEGEVFFESFNPDRHHLVTQIHTSI